MNLTGKTIVITGAAQGIGRALAVSFADHGSNLAPCSTCAKMALKKPGRCAFRVASR